MSCRELVVCSVFLLVIIGGLAAALGPVLGPLFVIGLLFVALKVYDICTRR